MSLAEPLAPGRVKPEGRVASPAKAKAKPNVRKLIFDLHLWVGIALAVWFGMLGLTGALLIFKPQVDRLTNPSLFTSHRPSATAQPITPDAALAAARAAYPEVAFRRVALPFGATGVFEFRFGKEKAEREVFVDSYSGRILGEREKHAAPLEWVLELHKALLLGKAGEQANGVGALFLVGLIATGIYLWWPANAKQWPQRFQVKRGASTKRLLYDLHNVFGIYALPVVLIIAITGAVFIYKKPVERVVYGLTGTPYERENEDHDKYEHKREDPSNPRKTAFASLPLNLGFLILESERLAPGTRLKHVDLPDQPNKPVRVHRERTGGFQVNNKVKLDLDPNTGAIRKVDDERTDPAGKKIMRWNGPLHEGKWAGLATQWLYLLIGLVVPLGLGITGVWKWWQTRQARLRNRTRREPA